MINLSVVLLLFLISLSASSFVLTLSEQNFPSSSAFLVIFLQKCVCMCFVSFFYQLLQIHLTALNFVLL